MRAAYKYGLALVPTLIVGALVPQAWSFWAEFGIIWFVAYVALSVCGRIFEGQWL